LRRRSRPRRNARRFDVLGPQILDGRVPTLGNKCRFSVFEHLEDLLQDGTSIKRPSGAYKLTLKGKRVLILGAHCQPTSLLRLQFKKCHKLWHFSRDAAARPFLFVKALCLFFIRTLLLSRCTQFPESRLFVFNPFPGFDCIITVFKRRTVAHKTRTKVSAKVCPGYKYKDDTILACIGFYPGFEYKQLGKFRELSATVGLSSGPRLSSSIMRTYISICPMSRCT
jgi:hypothetical protein